MCEAPRPYWEQVKDTEQVKTALAGPANAAKA